MTIPVQILLVIIGLAVSAQARLNAVVLGQHFSVPVLGLIFAVLILILAIAALMLARSLAREFRKPRHRWAYS
jgi:uncharacterized membrane protein YedE/YeeE